MSPRFEGIVEELPLVVYVDALDPESSAVYVSPTIAELTGWEPADFYEDRGLYTRLVHPDDREAFRAAVARRNAEGVPAGGEYRLVARDGRVVWVLDRETVVRDADGTPLYAQGYLLDVTERRSDRLRLSAVDTVLTAFAEGVSRDELIRRVLGALATALPGLRASFFRPEGERGLRIVHATEAPGLPPLAGFAVDFGEAERLLDELRAGSAVVVPDVACEPGLAAALDLAGAVGIAAFLGVPVLQRGRLTGALGLGSPTPRSFTESEVQSLLEIGRQLAVVLEREDDAADLHRRDAILSAVSRAAARLVAARDWQEVVSEVLRDLGRAVEASRSYVYELGGAGTQARLRHEWTAPGVERGRLEADLGAAGLSGIFDRLAAGQVVSINNGDGDGAEGGAGERRSIRSAVLVPVAAGAETWGFVGFDDCVRERRWSAAETDALRAAASLLGASIVRSRGQEALHELQARLAESERLESLGRLAGGVAHDFNNLLTAIAGYTGLLLERAGSDETLGGDLREIQRATERAAKLTRQLLAFGRRQVLQARPVSLSAVVDGLESMLTRLIGEDIVLVTDLDPDVGTVVIDPGQLEQVVVNLVVNARDAMPTGGTLSVVTTCIDREGESYAVLTVSDTGLGMDPQTRARAFEPFFTTRPDGVGLGLASVYGIVRQSGGEVDVTSEPGRGATFTVLLPRSDAPAEEVHAPSDAPVPPTAAAGAAGTILLVEDEDVVRSLARRVLEQHGYTVLESRDGYEAVELAEGDDRPIDLLLTDVVMPGLRGHEVANRVAASRPGIKVLYMSGYADEDLPGGEGDDRHFLEKPFSTDALARKIRELLEPARR